MGFLDRVNDLTKGLGEETVRVVDYEKQESEKVEKPKKAEKPKKDKVPRKSFSDRINEGKAKIADKLDPEDNDEYVESIYDNVDDSIQTEQATLDDDDSPYGFDNDDDNDDPFDIDEDDVDYGQSEEVSEDQEVIYEPDGYDDEEVITYPVEEEYATDEVQAERKPKRWNLSIPKVSIPKIERKTKPRATSQEEDTSSQEEDKSIKVDEKRAHDILEILNIPTTFDVPYDVYMPDDLDEVMFDTQSPEGYEMGQVQMFKTRVEKSLHAYVKFLEQRNRDIMLLASTVDKMEADMQQQRLDVELANGVNIMPSTDMEDLENQLAELRILNRQYEEELEILRNYNNAPTSSAPAADNADDLSAAMDQISVLSHEKNALSDENYELRNQLALLQEREDVAAHEEVQKKFNLTFDDPRSLPDEVEDDSPLDDLAGNIDYMDEDISDIPTGDFSLLQNNEAGVGLNNADDGFMTNSNEVPENGSSDDNPFSPIDSPLAPEPEDIGFDTIPGEDNTSGSIFDIDDEDDNDDFLEKMMREENN